MKAFMIIAVLLLASCIAVPDPDDPPDVPDDSDMDFPTQSGTLWHPHLEWEITNPSYSGNPFDVIADVTFTHSESGEQITTQMFYDGGDMWRFRFSGTRTGEWSFVTSSADADLDGLRGYALIDENPDPSARGFLLAHDGRFAVQTGEDDIAGTLYNVYMNHAFAERLNEYSSDENELAMQVDELLSEVEAHGFDALFVIIANNWFEYGELRHDRHSSENPSLDSFRILETIILAAQERGLFVHIWAWGDEQRRWTQIGVGGINGEPDKRLQRYIAARLGALPGWTMSYAFDLGEWVEPNEVREWHAYLHEHFGWPRLLMARETEEGKTHHVFELGDDKLDVFSNDERPSRDFYDTAVSLLDSVDIPVISERRFLHTRDDVWDMDTTRQALWQFTMAGGKGAIWGVMWDDGPPYPTPEQLRIHGQFWNDRFRLDFERANDLTDGYALRSADNRRFVFYNEDTDEIRLDLSAMAGARSAIAVDTKADAYEEISLGTLDANDHVWNAPYRSDWAIAVG